LEAEKVTLLYKEDWEDTKERYKAWWAGEYFGRCALSVTAPRADAPDQTEPQEPSTPLEKWTNLDYRSALAEWRLRRTFYGGEAFPGWDYGYPGHKRLAAFLGSPVELGFKTGWLDPILTGEDIEYEGLTLDEEGERWKFAISWLERGARESKGKCIPAIGAFGGCGDTLAALRGTDRLLYDVIDRPEEVRTADQFLMDLWIKAYDRFHAITREAAEGSTCWFPLWSPGKFYATQNDFAYMISPEMFRDVFLPALEKQTQFLDHAVHHVDGVGNFAHVDALCELPRLQALQILPGAGKPSPLHYMDVLKKVQDAGKNLHVSIPASEVKQALEGLSARGLFISTRCETEADARELLKKAERWSRDRRPAPAASS
jgi:hypothetical protein